MANLGEIMVKIQADISDFQKDMDKMNQKLSQVGDQMKQVGNQVSTSAQGMQNKIGDATNKSGKNWEWLRDKMISSNDRMMAKATQSQKIIDNFKRMDVRKLDQQFLKLGDSLEKMAKKGAVTNVALNELGRHASFKQLKDQIKLINQGLMRMQALQLGVGIAFVAMNVGLAKMSNVVDGRLIPAFNEFKKTWLVALTPFIKAWTTAVVGVIKFGTAVGRVFVALAKFSPLLSQIIFGILFLTTALVLLLAPLAIGISAVGSFAAAFTALWAIIGPFVTGLLAVIGTASLWAVAIAAVVAAIYLLWTRSEAFRSVILSVWAAIKNGFQQVVAYLRPAVAAVVAFITQQWNVIKAWWATNGKTILQAIRVVFNAIKPLVNTAIKPLIPLFKGVFNGIVIAVRTAWNIIKTVISGAIKIILNTISLFANLLTGRWRAAWNNVKTIASTSLNGMKSIISSILSGIANSAFSWGSNLASMFGSGIRSKISSAVSAARSAASQIKSYLGFSSPTKEGPGSNADHWAPNLMNMFSGGIKAGIPRLKTAVTQAAHITTQMQATGATGSTTSISPTVNIYPKQANFTPRQLIREWDRMRWVGGGGG